MSNFVKEVANEINSLVASTSKAIGAIPATIPPPSPPTIPPLSKAAARAAAMRTALMSGCRICVRHGLTGKLEPREYKQYFYSMEFHRISPDAAITDFERHVEFVTAYKVPKSMNRSQASALLASPDLKDKLYHLTRIFEFPIPYSKTPKQIEMLDEGFNLQIDSNKAYYCGSKIDHYVSLKKAIETINFVFKYFCFDPAHPQSRVHAIARLLTPYCQGLMGFTAKSPLWIFQANRSRAGKDYCAAVTPLVFKGIAHEDAPLDFDDSENKRRITAAIIAGHKFMHFANCKLDLDKCPSLEAAITAKFWNDRIIGTSESVQMSNEIIYSLSFNGALKLSEDMANRTRRIKFFLAPTVKANKRPFPFDLHKWLATDNGRRKVIASLHALVENWKVTGRTPGPEFTSFPEWGEVVGGIMMAAGLGNPCDSDPDDEKCVPRTWEGDVRKLTDIISTAEPGVLLDTAEVVAKYVKTNPDLLAGMDGYEDDIAYSRELGQKLSRFSGSDLGGGLKIEKDLSAPSRPKYKFHPAIKIATPPPVTGTEFYPYKRKRGVFNPFEI